MKWIIYFFRLLYQNIDVTFIKKQNEQRIKEVQPEKSLFVRRYVRTVKLQYFVRTLNKSTLHCTYMSSFAVLIDSVVMKRDEVDRWMDEYSR